MSRYTVDLPEEIDSRLTVIAEQEGISKGQAMRKAFALLSVAASEREKGNSLGVVKESDDGDSLEAIARIVD